MLQKGSPDTSSLLLLVLTTGSTALFGAWARERRRLRPCRGYCGKPYPAALGLNRVHGGNNLVSVDDVAEVEDTLQVRAGGLEVRAQISWLHAQCRGDASQSEGNTASFASNTRPTGARVMQQHQQLSHRASVAKQGMPQHAFPAAGACTCCT